MKTRDRILDKALELMNTKGLENVSTYDIARALDIRQSNITYYFATKQDIVNALAKRMVVDVDSISVVADPQLFSINAFYTIVEETMKVHEKYRFILMNYAQVITADSELHSHYVQVLKGRPAQFEGMVAMLDANGYVKGNELSVHSQYLTLLLNMTAIYWVQEAAIYMAKKSDKVKRKHHLAIFFQAFVPYMTNKGKKELEILLGKSI
ncbi:MAG TPA: TetR/AcrR family transcriptional regulator, partial [Flavipsychrobacter sp.]